jgi:hypothetical protein
MKIHDPAFLVAEISQASNWPGASNKLTIKILTNVELDGHLGANLTLTTSPDRSSSPAPFIVGDQLDGVFCGVSVTSADDLFILFSEERVRARFGKVGMANLGSSGCTAQSPCQACAGHCDDDQDCALGLKCYNRSGSQPSDIPGCPKTGFTTDTDYCYDSDSAGAGWPVDDKNAEHFACVKAKYTYTNRTEAWSYINISTVVKVNSASFT